MHLHTVRERSLCATHETERGKVGICLRPALDLTLESLAPEADTSVSHQLVHASGALSETWPQCKTPCCNPSKCPTPSAWNGLERARRHWQHDWPQRGDQRKNNMLTKHAGMKMSPGCNCRRTRFQSSWHKSSLLCQVILSSDPSAAEAITKKDAAQRP